MSHRSIRWIFLVLIIAVVGILIWHYSRPDPVEVVVAPVERGTVERTVANTRAGTVKACRRAKLSPSIGGQIARLPIREGQVVKAGELLLELWNRDLVAQVKLAQSEVETSKAQERAACLKADLAQREAARQVKLRESGAVSEDQADKRVTEAKALRAECEAAKTTAHMTESRLGVAEANLARTRLLAPFDGVVAEISGELSEYLTPSPTGIPTPPAVDLIDNSCFYVTAPIDEVDTPFIRPGMPARVSLDAFGNRRFEGRVRRVAPYVLDREKQARTVDVEVRFANPDNSEKLLAGYSADIEIILDVRRDVLRVPTEAVLDGNRVFVYLPDKKVTVERIFKRGLSNWFYTEVLSGLNKDDLVVVNADQEGLKNGVRAVLFREEP